MHLILPNTPFDVENLKPGERLYFLAGPISGGGDWHKKAIQLLVKNDPNCYIACPAYTIEKSSGHELFSFSIDPNGNYRRLPPFPDQTNWERYFMKHATRLGALLFWLGNEDKNNPRDPKTGPYARDTRGEIARWSVLGAQNFGAGKHDESNMYIGADPEFPGLKQIQKNLDADYRDYGNLDKDNYVYVTIFNDIQSIINGAVQKAKKMNPQPLFNESNC